MHVGIGRGGRGKSIAAMLAAGLTAITSSLALSAPALAVVLPDHRVWELVSPLDKNGADIVGIDEAFSGGVAQASEDGNSVTYVSTGSFGTPQGAPVGSQYLSDRGITGWTTKNITTPTNSKMYGIIGYGTPYKAFSADLSKSLFRNGDTTPVEGPPIAGAPSGYQNYYLRDDSNGELHPILTSVPEESPSAFNLTFADATSDLSRVFVTTPPALTPGALASNGESNIYEWFEGGLRAVNILPNVGGGLTAPGAFVGSLTKFNERSEDRAISDDGSRVFWSREGRSGTSSEEELFMRENGIRTVQVDASQNSLNPEEGGHGLFWTASSDGEKVFFTDTRRLTDDSSADKGGVVNLEQEDLYEFNVGSGRLTDLTVDHNPGDENGASVQGVLETSKDGSYVYFVARGVLSSEANGEGAEPVSGGDNLYARHGEHTTFIATLTPEDNSPSPDLIGVPHVWGLSLSTRTERLSPDGRYLVFMSSGRLTGYDNRDAVTQDPDEEVYVYDAHLNKLLCVSCNPSGARPIGPSNIPAATDFRLPGNGPSATHQSRVLSADGSRVFFNSSDSLVPQDTNGKQDVYEYENGHAYLISGGTDPGVTVLVNGSSFVDASADGSNVFFITRQSLVPQDTDQLVDLYDAREGGSPPLPPPPLPCSGESCKPVEVPQQVTGSPDSMTFSGLGNLMVQPAAKPAKHRPKRRHIRHRAGRRQGRGRSGRVAGKARVRPS
jgi:hypothetical protein